MDAIQPAIASREPLDAFVGGCARCGYNLRGLIDPRCPECGLAFDVGNSWPRRWIQWRGEAMRQSLTSLGGAAFISCFASLVKVAHSQGGSGNWMALVAAVSAGMVIVAFVAGIVSVAVAGKWMWEQSCGAFSRLCGLHAPTLEDEILWPPGQAPRLNPTLQIVFGVVAAIFVMCAWLPAVIFSPFWLPPVALLMFWVEHRRTQARLAGALLTPYSIDTRRQFAGYLGWGCVLSVFAAVGWVGCLFAL